MEKERGGEEKKYFSFLFKQFKFVFSNIILNVYYIVIRWQ